MSDLLPLTSWADRLGGAAPFLADILAHPTDGPYWWSSDFRRHLYNVAIPMLHVGSWYDEFQEDSLLMYEDISAKATEPAARDGQALLMGPWAHLLPYFVPTSTGTGDIDFGPEALIDLQYGCRQIAISNGVLRSKFMLAEIGAVGDVGIPRQIISLAPEVL